MSELPLFLGMSIHLWATFAVVCTAMYLYASERLPMEMTSLTILCTLLFLFTFAPFTPEDAEKAFKPDELLAGLSNPALLAVLSLLVIGQAMVLTGSLNGLTNLIIRLFKERPRISVSVTVGMAVITSMFLNDTPTCVIYMPILLAIAAKLGMSASKVMIPLSYATILGGTVTLIGSSTNLLVSGAAVSMGLEPLGLFDFTLPGIIIAVVGFLYLVTVLPHLLPDRAPLSSDLVGDRKREFVIQLEVQSASALIGKPINQENLLGIKNVGIKMLQRSEHAYLAPFDEPIAIRPYDVIVLTATKDALIELLSAKEKHMFGRIAALNAQMAAEEGGAENLVLAEVLVAPASRMIGQNVEQIGFYHNYHCTVMGIQRRSRMITSRMTEIRLAAGDVLLVMGTREHIEAMRASKDLMLMEWSMHELPSPRNALKVNFIFAAAIAAAAFDVVPIHISAMAGAIILLLIGCLNTRQAARALDGQIILLVAAGMALATALEVTGGAAFLAEQIVTLMQGANPVWVMSALFALMAVSTNLLSNNACGLIFTPIAINTARKLGVEPAMFIHAVIFASNCCSFATPIGYQTNLLVMGPGHYSFRDYMRAGIPLMVLVWITYTAFCFLYY